MASSTVSARNLYDRLEIALNKIGLGTLIQGFKDEKLDFDTILSASESDLTRLGVVTIGDKVRLREVCKKEKADMAIGNESMQSTSSYSNTIRERSLLFSSRLGVGSSRRRGGHASGNQKLNAKKRPWTVSFMCLASKYSCRVPTSTEKLILQNAGLGFKKIKLDLEDDEEEVFRKLTSSDKDFDDSYSLIGFPPLKECGGFELLSCLANSRDLRVISCSLSAKELKSKLGGGQSKVYIRPIQKSLSTIPIIKEETSSSLKEKCISCGEEMLLREIRKHIQSCGDQDEVHTVDAFELEEDDRILTESVFYSQPAPVPQISDEEDEKLESDDAHSTASNDDQVQSILENEENAMLEIFRSSIL